MTRKFTLFSISALALGLGLASACNKNGNDTQKIIVEFKSPAGIPVAQIGDRVLTDEFILEQIDGDKGMMSSVGKTPESKRKYVESKTKQEVLFMEALKRGYINDPQVQRDIKRALSGALTRAETKKLMQTVKGTEEEAQAYYNKNIEEFQKPERLQTDFHFIPFGNDKAAALKQAQEDYKKSVASGKEFSRMFHEDFAKDPKLEDNMRPLSREKMTAAFGPDITEKLWNYKYKTDVTPVLVGENGYYIFGKPTKHKAVNHPYAEVKDEMLKKAQYYKQKDIFMNWIEDLKKSYGVKVLEDGLAKLDVNREPASWKTAQK